MAPTQIDNALFRAHPFAHRGLHNFQAGIIENSLPAIKTACMHGYGVEIDVRLSRDNVVFVFHDYSLERLTSHTGIFNKFDAATLSKFSLKGSHGATIITLQEVLSTINGTAPLLIELKPHDEQLTGTDGRLERSIARIIRKYSGPVALMSFNIDHIKTVQSLLTHVSCGLIGPPCSYYHTPSKMPAHNIHDYHPDDLEKMNIDFINYNHQALDSPIIRSAKKRNIPVLCWTIRNEKQQKKALEITDNIIFENYMPRSI